MTQERNETILHDRPETAIRDQNDQFVIAIGASAGGLEAIHDFFDHMPECKDAAFVVIQHLSPDYKSLLVELVGRHTHMKVFEAEHNLPVQSNCIYIIPNNKFITISHNRLMLVEKKQEKAPNNAVDIFLQSLARDKKDKAITVILSGTGTDGTRGIEAIKQEGGMVLVQDPATARFDGMPNSAIGSGHLDVILKPSDMPGEILKYIRHTSVDDLSDANVDDRSLEIIFDLIHREAGFDFHYYKTPTIMRRIVRRVDLGNYKSIKDYIEFLRKNPEECRQLEKDFLIGVTRFFRDTEAFAHLRERVLEPIIEEKEKDGQVKVWACACSTGEEAYSIAILINEIMEAKGRILDVKIFATDPDATHIEIANKGVYPLSIAEDVPEALLGKYFIRNAGTYTVVPNVRKQIVFARHNVIKDPPFIKNDLVTCRNMLIYMSTVLQQKIFSVLLFASRVQGFLFIGSSETANFAKDSVVEISGKWKIYRKITDTKLGGHLLHHLPESLQVQRKSGTGAYPGAATRGQQQLWDDSRDALTEEWGLAAFYIDQSFDIKEAVGDFQSLLSIPKNNLQLNLLKMLPTGISLLLHTEIRKAWTENRKVLLRNLQYRNGDKNQSLEILIKPPQPSLRSPYTLVLLRLDIPAPKPQESPQPSINDTDLPEHAYVATLETELQETRQHLQLAIEDLETANEELQSSNEELLSANEELQSSNEELQSLNEELHTLNTEHQLKIRELMEANDDLNNYFRSTDIGQVFLDKDLRIRKFNPASARMINFIESDLGRSITHISSNIRYEHLQTDIQAVLENGEIVEKEVRLFDGKNLLMRIMPYLSRDKNQGGIIITFVDITTVTQLNNIVRGIFNSSPSAILAFHSVRDPQNEILEFCVLAANYAAGVFLKGSGADFPGKMVKQDIPLLASHGLFKLYTDVVQQDKKMSRDVFFEEQEKWYEVTAVKMMDGLVATFTDITEKKMADQQGKRNYEELLDVKENLRRLNEDLEDKVRDRTKELFKSEERFRLVARATNDALWDWDLLSDTLWWGNAFFKLFGYKQFLAGPIDRVFWRERIHPDDRSQTEESLSAIINSRNTQWSQEYRFLKEDGTYAHILDRAYILHDEQGTPYRMLGSMLDLTELKQAEQEIKIMNEQLEQKVVKRTRELGEINKALEESNHDLLQFASVASHDLQEPLRKILIFSNLIKEKYSDKLPLGGMSYLDKISHATGRMKSLVVDILNYSRLSSQSFRFEKVALQDIVSDILDDFEIAIREKGAQVHVGSLPEVEAIPGQIRQVFQNLISNALKFTRDEVPPLVHIHAVRAAEKALDSPEDPAGGFCRIHIKDNGIGFDEKFSQVIFNLFHRLNSKDRYEGTGIGLAVTKKIIERHDGLILASSVEGQGAEFILVLPLWQAV